MAKLSATIALVAAAAAGALGFGGDATFVPLGETTHGQVSVTAEQARLAASMTGNIKNEGPRFIFCLIFPKIFCAD